MAIVKLTIKKDYLPGWGLWEGVRELVQNGKDAEVEHGAKLTVEWRPSSVTPLGGRLHIENEGTSIPRSALLMGETSKEGRDDLIGKFGEGLKIGILALARLGRSVLVRSGPEVWRATLTMAEEFNATVLAFQIQGGRKDQSRTVVEIDMTRKEWEEFRPRFLFLGTATPDDRIETPTGTLLTAPRFKGKLYVKGIFVAESPTLSYGFDLKRAKIDRDRKMVDPFSLQSETRRVLTAAVAQRPDLFDRYFRLVERGADDARYNAWEGGEIPAEIRALAVAKFRERHGEDALPVATLDESKTLEHLGKRGVVCGESLRAILVDLGSTREAIAKLREEVTATYSWGDLSPIERAYVDRAVRRVALAVEDFTMEKVDVVDFRDKKLLGQHKDGRYLLARRALKSRAEALGVLVHEVAHDRGLDGEKSHGAEVERIWSAIAEACDRERTVAIESVDEQVAEQVAA